MRLKLLELTLNESPEELKAFLLRFDKVTIKNLICIADEVLLEKMDKENNTNCYICSMPNWTDDSFESIRLTIIELYGQKFWDKHYNDLLIGKK